MQKLKKSAVLEFNFTNPERQLSEAYQRVAKEQIGLEPTIFKLPWPADMIPVVGSNFDSSYLPSPFDHGVVEEVGYVYSRKEGIRVEIVIAMENADSSRHVFNDECLTHLAEQGFLFDSNASITKALKEAGLPITVAALKRGKATAK